MEILLRLLTAQLNVEETLYSQLELWPALFGHVAVVADDTISLQLLRVLVNETRQVWTPDLLFALDNELEIERNIAGTFEIALSRFDERDNIVLAICRAPRDNLRPQSRHVHLFLHNLSTILDPKLLSRNTRLLQQSAEVL